VIAARSFVGWYNGLPAHVSVSFLYLPSGQNRQKNTLKECVLVNSALKLQCHIVKIAHWVIIGIQSTLDYNFISSFIIIV